jgi:putative ABC transport system permease protein
MIPLRYNVRSLFVRTTATLLTLLAIALSVAVLVLVLSLAAGFEGVLAGTGAVDNVIVLRRGATSEGVSVFTKEAARKVEALPYFARSEAGRPLVEAELYAGVSLEKATGGSTNIPIRGVGEHALEIRAQVRLAQGRWFKPGLTELVVGKGLLERVKGCRLGGVIQVANREWPVVGVIDSDGGAYDSEIWGDVVVLVDVFDRQGFNLVIGRISPQAAFSVVRTEVESDTEIHARVFSEQEYFANQSGVLGDVMKGLAWILAAIMSMGAVFGAANTLFASVSARTREIGTLLAMGFGPGAVFVSFLIEAVVMALLGGILGILLAIPVHGMSTGTTNWATFTEQTFAFRITPGVVVAALCLSLLIGLLGGALPALRASRLRPVEALQKL